METTHATSLLGQQADKMRRVEELNEEDQKLKDELEMLVERLTVCFCADLARSPPSANMMV